MKHTARWSASIGLSALGLLATPVAVAQKAQAPTAAQSVRMGGFMAFSQGDRQNDVPR